MDRRFQPTHNELFLSRDSRHLNRRHEFITALEEVMPAANKGSFVYSKPYGVCGLRELLKLSQKIDASWNHSQEGEKMKKKGEQPVGRASFSRGTLKAA